MTEEMLRFVHHSKTNHRDIFAATSASGLDLSDIAFRGTSYGRFRTIGDNLAIPCSVEPFVSIWFSCINNPPYSFGIEWDKIRITIHKANITLVTDDIDCVASEQCTFAIGPFRPMKHAAAGEVTATSHRR